VPASKQGVSVLRQIARAKPQDGGTLADDPAFTAQIADIDLQVQALEMSELRVLSTMAQGGAPGRSLRSRSAVPKSSSASPSSRWKRWARCPAYQPGMLFRTQTKRRSGPITRHPLPRAISTCARPHLRRQH
jgi:hypothetical protein